MQPIPLRLAQVIRTTFQASKPPSRAFRPLLSTPNTTRTFPRSCPHTRIAAHAGIRFYSDGKKDLDNKIETAKKRIDDTLETRSEHVKIATPEPAQDTTSETIVHTHPEASSIVHPKSSSQGSEPSTPSAQDAFTPPNSYHPSSTSKPLTKRFSHLMDNLQANLFVASRRLNDLTGYTGIERLKDDITRQEDHVLACRTAVRAGRKSYAAAIETRSTTQREVNDLLHRKHTWTPNDLERFTNLYRSDHANERAEEQAQQELSRAESAYEEASTKLARTILARYHEEQIWSDKIRQMSTWGTWGLMGLNVLLFVVFQIAIEPWRRRRLVSGFEEKVQEALKEVGDKATLAAQVPAEVKIVVPQKEGQSVADGLAGAIVDAVSGIAAEGQVSAVQSQSQAEVEAAIEDVDAQERRQEAEEKEDMSFPNPVIGEEPAFATTPASGYAYYQEAFAELFSERKITVTRRELTNAMLEGAAGGAALVGLLVVLLRPR